MYDTSRALVSHFRLRITPLASRECSVSSLASFLSPLASRLFAPRTPSLASRVYVPIISSLASQLSCLASRPYRLSPPAIVEHIRFLTFQ
jgi:hypothetical protein